VTDIAISTDGLVKRYGRVTALTGLDLEVRTGEVFGFLGPNGAGKTTTIRLLLDLIRPTAGRVSLLGLDPTKDGLEVRRRAGFLGGDFVVDGRQTARELLVYLGNLRGGIPVAAIDHLAQRLDLDLDRPIKALSRGNRQKVGVVQAFMHEPEILILDEPTTGLDPFLQHEFAAMVRQAASEGRTVFMSSHVMSEVQRTADRVGIIREGRLVSVEGVDTLRSRARRRIEIVFDTPVGEAEFSNIAGVSNLRVDGTTLRCRLDGRADDFIKAAARHGVITLSAEEPDLEELFFDRFSGDNDAP
jgi:ABC-2 type transport system ATP-binding protein